LLISGDYIGDAESDLPGALADGGEVAEVKGRVEKLRRLADGGEGQFVTLHTVVAQTVTATHDRLLVAEDVICKPEHGTELHAAALDATREVAVFAPDHTIERIARSRNDASYQISWQQSARICRIISALVCITIAEFVVYEFTGYAGWPVKPHGL